MSVVLVACVLVGAVALAGAHWQPVRPSGQIENSDVPELDTAEKVLDPTSAAAAVRAFMSGLDARSLPGAAGAATAATARPLSRACDKTVPQLASGRKLVGVDGAASLGVSIEVYGAGLGGRTLAGARQAAIECGAYVRSAPSALGSGGLRSSKGTIAELRWRRGDVIVSVSAYDQAGARELDALAGELDALLVRVLDGRCALLDAGEDDARRNPTQGDYRPYTIERTAPDPVDVPRPDPGLLNEPLPVVEAPAVGVVTVAPSAPRRPVPPPAATVTVEAADVIGPGCGWAFTGQRAPVLDTVAAERATAASLEAATAATAEAWAAWPATAAAWRDAQATYLALLESYTAWQRAQTAPTTTVPGDGGDGAGEGSSGDTSPTPSVPVTAPVTQPPSSLPSA
jgi:hypothetical protein